MLRIFEKNNYYYSFRYRNYRTFASPRPVQFSCLAIDSANEFVAAGAQDVFEIYLWSMKIGHLLEVHFNALLPFPYLSLFYSQHRIFLVSFQS